MAESGATVGTDESAENQFPRLKQLLQAITDP